MARPRYLSRAGAHLSRARTQRMGEEIGRLVAEGRGAPADIVEAARDPRSSLHNEFPWDDHVAAEKCRLDIANKLLAVFRVTIVADGRPKTVRAFHRVVENGRRTTRTAVDVFSSDDLKQQVVQEALQQMQCFVDRWEGYTELAEARRLVIVAIRSVRNG